MTKLLSSALLLLLACGCGGDAFSEGQGGARAVSEAGKSSSGGSGESGESGGGRSSSGGASSGGNSTAGRGGGGKSSGGSGVAGDDSGGMSSGGRSGSASGGESMGGMSNGGVSTGGVSTGGVSNGGVSTGGMPTGGSTSTTSCQRASDCVSCAYASAPNTVLNCYCVGCADTPMNVTSCNQNQERWEKVCSAVDLACPPIKCQPPEPVRCEKGRCVDAQ